LNDSGRSGEGAGFEDRASKDPFESGNQAAILLAAGVRSEACEHLAAAVRNRITCLLDGKSGEEDRNQAILAERDTEVGTTRDLKKETAVSPFKGVALSEGAGWSDRIGRTDVN
jgi:hypothetical protein